jgi:hypothetical protein
VSLDLIRCFPFSSLQRPPRTTLLPPGRVRPEPSRCSISTSARASARCRRSRAPLQRPCRVARAAIPSHGGSRCFPAGLRRAASTTPHLLRVRVPSRHRLPRPRSHASPHVCTSSAWGRSRPHQPCRARRQRHARVNPVPLTAVRHLGPPAPAQLPHLPPRARVHALRASAPLTCRPRVWPPARLPLRCASPRPNPCRAVATRQPSRRPALQLSRAAPRSWAARLLSSPPPPARLQLPRACCAQRPLRPAPACPRVRPRLAAPTRRALPGAAAVACCCGCPSQWRRGWMR